VPSPSEQPDPSTPATPAVPAQDSATTPETVDVNPNLQPGGNPDAVNVNPNLAPGGDVPEKTLLRGGDAAAPANPQTSASNAPTPLGRGNTGRTTNNLNEQLKMEQVRSDPQGNGIPAPSGKTGMNDPRWPSKDGWVKMRNKDDTIHWVQNQRTGEVDDFKST
jgi:hypothetical protein